MKAIKEKFNKMLEYIPAPVMLLVLLTTSIVNGIVVSLTNVNEAAIVNGFTMRLFVVEIVCYSAIVICNLIDKLFNKGYKNRVLNSQYNILLERVLNSKMTDIQRHSTGKVFDAVKDIASLTAGVRLYWIWIIPTIIPFVTLIYKETVMDWRMAVVSISGVCLSFTMTMISDKLFQFNIEQKKKKAIMQEVTVDNFMNTKTIKYLGVNKFAINRLIKSQHESWNSMLNPGQVFWFRLCDIVGIAPLIINIWIARNSPEMIALIVISNWTLDNMRGHLAGIAENVLELNAQKEIIKDLKGDDIENRVLIDSRGIRLTDVFFDYGKDSVKFHLEELNVNKGDKILVYGESGEGKSSLANLLAGGIKPTTGEVPALDVYYVWQETECLADTLWHNIVFEDPYDIPEGEILGLFKELNMLEWFESLKDGFQTHIGERGCKLSSGQKQRINIIRVLIEMTYKPNKVFIMDEITSNLDDETKNLVINKFKEVFDKNPELTVVMISHNDGFDKLATREIEVRDHQFIIK